jgi:class 3 adenylate cyclase
MSTWLAVALVVVTALSLLLGTVITVFQATRLGERVVQARAQVLLSLQANEVERYLAAAQTSATVLASSRTIREAATRFGDAYQELGPQLRPSDVESATDALTAYYRAGLVPALEEVTGNDVSVPQVLPSRDAARYLQSLYTIPDPTAGVPARERVDAEDGSAWSAVHAELHPDLLQTTEQLGFDDLALITADTGTVVYTADKLPDLGTSLDVGPYSGSVLARGFRAVRDQPEAGAVLVTDIAQYGPAGGAPAGYVVAPVFDGQELVAVLAVRISIDEIDRIMTAGGRWDEAGFGKTAETFLVGADGRMRSVARPFVEDPERYLEMVEQAGTATAQQREAMLATGTTVPVQEVFTDQEMIAVAAGEPGLVDPVGYRGEEVRTAVAPLDVAGPDWTVVAQTTEAELAAPLLTYRRSAVVAAVIVIVALAFLAVAWARRTFEPVRAISERLRGIREGDDPGPVPVGGRTPAEFAELAGSVDDMIDALHRRRAEVDAAIAERRTTMHALLPASVAERLDAGDRRVVDEISRASVVVLTVEGLGRLLHGDDAESGRATMDRIVGALDPLAEHHGLVRVKLLGDAYFAGCGLDRPYLDDAARATSFAVAAHEAVAQLTDGLSEPVRLSAGVDSGPVVVGLTGSSLLVFDMWGETSTAAHHLAQRALPGETLVSARTHALLPPTIDAVPYDGPGPPAWRITQPVPAAAEEAPS